MALGRKLTKCGNFRPTCTPIPTVKLPEDLQGHYTIRKAPSNNSLSTVEAGFHALNLMESGKDFTPLLTAFEKMIEFQIAQMPPGVFEKNYLKNE